MAGSDPFSAISGWAGGGATATLGAGQTLYGLYLNKHNKRPTYEIPAEIQQNLNQAQQQALQGMPEAQQQQYLNNLQQSTAYELQQSGSRKAGLTGIAALNQQNNNSLNQLADQNAQIRLNNLGQLYNARNQMADYKGQAFQINQENPYYEKVAQSQALIGAGMQNLSQGFQQGNQGNVNWGNGGGGQTKMDSFNPSQVNYEMSPYQFASQNSTPNPYSGQQELQLPSGYSSGFNYGGFEG